ncbi:AfsR family transcriptional regulator [Streptacidiphilus sp. PB12-B1b]|uniref:AfsR/SARP family transcriptional regulator n=1 Tax=Streptacidiphilus sp. PB12-B1b TaxID=2705012 RepID=UPI0015FD9B72|nr:BTAD domain-containing putative transcriptional regulator [Streptacidiphilus sp. PB12-B1b]QMU76797.1 AfsR family transcriptional regulator [Streptacidiphilus sp. PB12-B1b]
MTTVRYAVLGPVRVWRGDTELVLGPPKQRALLALLAVRAPEPVTVHEAVDVLWDGEPPLSAVNVVHRHIGSLRRLLDPAPDSGAEESRAEGRLLVRGTGGYRLPADAAALDLARFRELRAEAQRSVAAGALEDGARRFTDALLLWRGPVGAGTLPHLHQHPVFVAVENEYVAAAKEAADVVPWQASPLAEGVLAVLRAATAGRYRLDEALQARVVTALAATGRQAEALELFASLRAELAEELGIDPGPELLAAQRQVLRQSAATAPQTRPEEPGAEEPTAADTTDGGGMQSAVKVRPAQLPVGIAAFVGRQDRIEHSLTQLPPHPGQPGPPMAIGVISGMAGVGKTTLAVHWAHLVADRFPDGQLYVNLRGFHPSMPPLDPLDAMRDVIEALGVPQQQVPDSPDALGALYRSLFVGRRLMILLDNCRDAEQVRPLLPAAAGCLALITSRHRLDALVVADNIRFIPLDPLTPAEGMDLLVRRLGQERVAKEPAAAQAIVEHSGRLPLALAIVAARAVLHPTFPLASIADELRESHGGLDAFISRDASTDARSVFSWSYQALSPAAAQLFRLLSLHAAPDVAVAAAASLAGVPLREARGRLAELVEHHLLTEHLPGRFSCHELLRAYAVELCESQDSEEDRRETCRRLVEHYLHTAHNADVLLAPHRERVELLPAAPGVSPQGFRGEAEAADWFQGERQVLLALVEQAGQHAREGDESCWKLASLIELFLDRHGRWQELLHVQTTALEAARRTRDRSGQAHALRALGLAACRLGAHDDARRHLAAALDLFGQLGDHGGQAGAHRYAAFLANVLQDHHAALEHYRLAGECYTLTGYVSGLAKLHNEIGWTRLLMGDHEAAVVQCEKAVAMHQEIGDRSGEAAAWDSRGYAQQHLGLHEQALDSYDHAVGLYHRMGDRSLEADTLVHVGESHQARGDHRSARAAWQRALELYAQLDHPEAAAVRERLEQLG